MTVLVDSALKVSLLVAATLALMPLLGRQSAAMRHWLLAAALVSAAPMPLLTRFAPAWQGPLAKISNAPTPRPAAPAATLIVSTAPAGAAAAHDADTTATGAAPRATSLTAIVGLVWLAGVAASGSMLLIGFARLRRLAQRARPIDDRRWLDLVSAIGCDLGVRRPVRMLSGEHPTLLVTWGLRRPTIMLPSIARGWSDERLRIVLQHELAHVRRGDWLVQVAAESVRGLNWFNPIVWLAARQLRRESERACDDVVLSGGVAPADYASHLVDLARALSAHHRPYLPAPAMARASGLEGRIAAMLNAELNRRPLRARTRIAALGALIVAAVSVAGLGAQRFATFSGTLVDQTNAVLPGVTLSLADAAAQSRHEVRTDRTGHFELRGLSDGEYQLEIHELGFKTARETITIAGKDLARTIQLQVGDLQETIRVTSGGTATAADPAARQAARDYAEAQSRKVAERCAGGGGPVAGNIGGNIMQPTKVADVKPRYPEGAPPGVVHLEALIGTDGTIRDVRLVSGDAELGLAAAEAIRRWEFSPTYLNCMPIEVRMTITANFVAK